MALRAATLSNTALSLCSILQAGNANKKITIAVTADNSVYLTKYFFIDDYINNNKMNQREGDALFAIFISIVRGGYWN
jgi:hypothetical protein